MISKDVYLMPILNNAPRLLALLNRNISSSGFGSFDREYWHYNTVDFSNARKQEAALTLTLLYFIEHEKNRYYRDKEILTYIRAALLFWAKIQNKNGSFSEWYPNENSFVVTSFSSYAVSESLLLIRDELQEEEYQTVLRALTKAADWLIKRDETRVMNQQTGAATALLNVYLLTEDARYLDASRAKILLLKQRQSPEGWFLEYGGPDIGYLSLAIDYMSKYFKKTSDDVVREILDRALDFIKYFIQPDLVAGGVYASRNTEYLIPHGFEVCSGINSDAAFIASAVRKSLPKTDSFPGIFDDRYLTYVGYTWLQAYLEASPGLNESIDTNIDGHFRKSFRRHFKESGLLIVNDERKHLIMNMQKGASFRLYDKHAQRAYSDSGILVRAGGKWYTSGWLAEVQKDIEGDSIAVSGNMWKVPDRAMSPLQNILIRIFQITFGRSSFISLRVKEWLRDFLITKTKPSSIRYNRKMFFNEELNELIRIDDSVTADDKSISSITVFAKDTHIYVPSSRYCVGMTEAPFQKTFSQPVQKVEIGRKISRETGVQFTLNR